MKLTGIEQELRFMVDIATHNTARQQVRQVLIITLILNLVVALSKIIIGLWSGALSITADGFHSLVDGSSNVVALVANRIANQPPDDDHPYGHRRFETIAALGIGGFLLVTAWQISVNALERLSGDGTEASITPLSFVVMIGTLLVNIFVNQYESREGHRLNSELLIADATHTRTDIFVTISVLASMALIVLFSWQWVDTAAALLIVVLILRAAWGVLSQTGRVLVDTAPYTQEQLTRWVEELPCVDRVLRARSRGPLDAAQIDIDIQVAAEMTAGQTSAISEAVREQLRQKMDGLAEVEVHFVPSTSSNEDYALLARARADALGLTTHEVAVRNGEQGKVLEMHVEVPAGQTLGVAHKQVSDLEAKVKEELPELADVITHIEPAAAATGTSEPVVSEHTDAIKSEIMRLLETEFPHAHWHHLNLYISPGGFTAMMHVTLPAQISVEAAHRVAESAETVLRAKFPYVERITIHTEPPE